MKERIQKLITMWRERAEWAHAKMDVATRTIDKVAYEAVWLESARIGDDLISLLTRANEDGADVTETLRNYEKLIRAWVEEAAPFQVGGDLSHLMPKIGDSIVLLGLRLGIAALRREQAMKAERERPSKEQWTHPTWEPALPPPTPPPVKCEP